jgi:hypothetical protein
MLLETRMPSSGMLRRVALARTYISEVLSTSIITVTRIGELGTTLTHPNDGVAKFLPNVGYYKSYTP